VHDPTNAHYVGRWIPAEPYQSENLNTQALANLALRWRQYQVGQPYAELEFGTAYEETLSAGDRITCADVTVEVIEARSDKRKDDSMAVKVRVVA